MTPSSTPPFKGRAMQRACANLSESHGPQADSPPSPPASSRPGSPPTLRQISRCVSELSTKQDEPASYYAAETYQPNDPSPTMSPLQICQNAKRSEERAQSALPMRRGVRRVEAVPLGCRPKPHFNSEFRIVSRMLTVPANTDQLFPCSIVRQQLT